MGPGGRNRLDRLAGSGGRAPARAREDRGARGTSARTLHPARADVRGAGVARGGLRLQHGPRRPGRTGTARGGPVKVGIPTEIKPDEYRVAITPAGVRELVEHGHEVLIQRDAGEGSAIGDDAYASQGGAFYLEKPFGGRGVLLGGVPGVAAANVMVIGGGAVGFNAASIAIGMEADVFVFDLSIDRLRELDLAFGGQASTVYSSTLAIEEMLPRVDLVIGAVLVHGAKAPHVIRRKQLKLMKKHAVLVDVAIDQGGCFETSKPTTHADP